MTTTNNLWPDTRKQRGVAILTITIVILLVATIGTLMIGRVGMMEQKQVGTDTRSKELYSAANGGLEYGVNWLRQTYYDSTSGESGINYASLTWSDEDGDGLPEAGDTASPASLGNTTLATGEYGHTVTYRLMTDQKPVDLEDINGDGTADEVANIRPVILRVESRASPVNGDTHMTKTVSTDVVVAGRRLVAGNSTRPDGVFEAPPIVLEGCLSEDIGGNPDLSFALNEDGVGVASTTMDLSGSVENCLPVENMEGHLGLCDVEQYPDGCPSPGHPDNQDPGDVLATSEFRGGLQEPTSLWDTIFGEGTTKEDLLEMERQTPLEIVIVQADTLTYQAQRDVYDWNGNNWHQDLGTADEPVILFFDEAIDCPTINAGTVIHGIVYYEKEHCDNTGWGGGTIYGTFAKAGDMTGFNANAQLIATALDFGDSGISGGNNGYGAGDEYGIVLKFVRMPGTSSDHAATQ